MFRIVLLALTLYLFVNGFYIAGVLVLIVVGLITAVRHYNETHITPFGKGILW